MENEFALTSQDKKPTRSYGSLPARPIMVYPRTAEQREQFVRAAEESGRGLSPFIVATVQAVIDHNIIHQVVQLADADSAPVRVAVNARPAPAGDAKARLEAARKKFKLLKR